MLFRRKIYDPLRTADPIVTFSNKNTPNFHFLVLAGINICSEVFGKCLLKHQRDTFPHHAYGIDRVY